LKKFPFFGEHEAHPRVIDPGPIAMAYFTWKEAGLTSDCPSLQAMAARFEEAASLMRRMAGEGFQLERSAGVARITHPQAEVFDAWGFINEESPERQLTLIPDQPD
jgi:hypothetical protein